MNFRFFFLLNRTDLITFCGQQIDVHGDCNGESGKTVFRKFEDGQYGKGQRIVTRHPNILRSVLIGKKGWGLWKDQWSEGIADWTFTYEEILKEFSKRDIIIPDHFLKEFNDFIDKKKQRRYETYI